MKEYIRAQIPNVNLNPRVWIMKLAINWLRGDFLLVCNGKKEGRETNPSFTPPITKRFHILNIFPFSCTKKSSDTVALTNVSSGAAKRPCVALMIDKERKLYYY